MFDSSRSMQTLNILNKGLNTAVMRHQTISNNIANLNTPHYKRKEVNFEGELHRALYGPKPMPANKTNERHIQFKGEITLDQVKPKLHFEKDTFTRNDTNNVDLNQEMAELAKNNMMYDAIVTRIAGKFSSLKSVITKGGRAS
jgi:flagellar basal-body rod protein FlgB